MTAEKKSLKQRIRRIANRNGYPAGVSVAVVLAVFLLAVCSFTGPVAYAVGMVGGLEYKVLGDLPFPI